MGCNHCLEPTCLQGCPVDAYSKDPVTGIVRHSADACIGCQYCTWNCSYGVPQYNPERGVVGKCDMCHGRLSLGQAPACVSACPEGAIAIEIVERRGVARGGRRQRARAPGLPAGDQQPVDDARHAAGELPPERDGRVDVDQRRSRASALAARRDDGADAAGGGRVRHDLAAAAVRRVRASGGGGARIAARRRAGAGRVDAAPRPADPCLSRAAHVAALVAQPRGAAVLGFSAVAGVYAALLWFGLPGSAWRRRAHRRCSARRRDGERLHLPRAVAAGVEHAATRCCSSI